MEDLMPRPSASDAYVRRRAAEIIFPRVWGWLGREHGGCAEPDVIRDLMRVARPHADGYELAKTLERDCGWAADDSLVDILGSDWVDDAVNELTGQWVRCLGIRPRFKIGDNVTVKRQRRSEVAGIVVKVDEELAQYGVRYPDMPENSWTVVNFEDCDPVLAPEAMQGAA